MERKAVPRWVSYSTERCLAACAFHILSTTFAHFVLLAPERYISSLGSPHASGWLRISASNHGGSSGDVVRRQRAIGYCYSIVEIRYQSAGKVSRGSLCEWSCHLLSLFQGREGYDTIALGIVHPSHFNTDTCTYAHMHTNTQTHTSHTSQLREAMTISIC